MPDEMPTAQPDSPPADAPVPSTEPQPVVTPAPETTAPPSTEPPRAFNLPPEERWNQLRQERDQATQRAQQAEAMARMAVEKLTTPTAPVMPPNDPWEGLVNHTDPQTALFYQQQRKLVEATAERLADQKLQGVYQVVDAGRRELASLKVAHFRKENPDIVPGSPEESAIAGFVQQGHDIETAKKLALYDRQESELKALKAKQAGLGQKVSANQTAPTASIPSTAGLPGQPGDWRENVRNAARKGGSLADIVNAAGASRDTAPS